MLALVMAIWPQTSARASDLKNFDAWKQALRKDAIAFGIKPDVFDRALAGLRPDYSLPDLVRTKTKKRRAKGQAEFVRPPQAYLSRKLLANLARQGRQLMSKHREALRQIEREIGVAPAAVLAIWGRETAFGGYRLRHNALRALVTQAYAGRRARVFRRELFYALKLVQAGIGNAARLRSGGPRRRRGTGARTAPCALVSARPAAHRPRHRQGRRG
ncbi:MAG: lytic murein transglycosylase, partial [Pseudomonadota bacterium]